MGEKLYFTLKPSSWKIPQIVRLPQVLVKGLRLQHSVLPLTRGSTRPALFFKCKLFSLLGKSAVSLDRFELDFLTICIL